MVNPSNEQLMRAIKEWEKITLEINKRLTNLEDQVKNIEVRQTKESNEQFSNLEYECERTSEELAGRIGEIERCNLPFRIAELENTVRRIKEAFES